VGGDECRERLAGAGIVDPAPRHDHGPLGAADQPGHAGHLGGVGVGAADAPDPWREEALGPVPCLGLHALAEDERDRAAFGRVGHHRHHAGQRGKQLLGPGDAVEISADRAEAVVGADGGVAEISICWSTGSGPRPAKTSPGTNDTGRRLTCAVAAAVTMLVALAPMEEVTIIARRRRVCLGQAMAA
jgi:hypothetical protein